MYVVNYSLQEDEVCSLRAEVAGMIQRRLTLLGAEFVRCSLQEDEVCRLRAEVAGMIQRRQQTDARLSSLLYCLDVIEAESSALSEAGLAAMRRAKYQLSSCLSDTLAPSQTDDDDDDDDDDDRQDLTDSQVLSTLQTYLDLCPPAICFSKA